jgi:hypothetical protein
VDHVPVLVAEDLDLDVFGAGDVFLEEDGGVAEGAAGLGLGLVGADTVVFLEPDWNPFRDLQVRALGERRGKGGRGRGRRDENDELDRRARLTVALLCACPARLPSTRSLRPWTARTASARRGASASS